MVHVRREGTGSALRCGVCFRNLTLDPARSMHVVFGDGSMRCAAPETLERHPDATYVGTHVVFDSYLRRVAIERAFSRGVLTDPMAVAE
jgi:hypothetical protein